MDTRSEEFRHQCEVRHFLRIRLESGREAVTSSLASIEKRRGQQCAAALLRDIMSQWTRGNRGKQGDWRTE